jgi:hypothetical protein
VACVAVAGQFYFYRSETLICTHYHLSYHIGSSGIILGLPLVINEHWVFCTSGMVQQVIQPVFKLHLLMLCHVLLKCQLKDWWIVLSVQVVDTDVQDILLVVLLAWLPHHNYCGLDIQHLNRITRQLSSRWRSYVSTSQNMATVTAQQCQAEAETVWGGKDTCVHVHTLKLIMFIFVELINYL